MRNKDRRFTISTVGIILTICLVSWILSPVSGQQNPPTDLTGVWKCDDQGTYYIKQIGADVYWYGEQKTESPHFANIAYGKQYGDFVILKWIDIPKGETTANGDLTLKYTALGTMGPNNQVIWTQYLTAAKKTGGFGGSEWIK